MLGSLKFGSLMAAYAGEVVIDPRSRNRHATGGVTLISNNFQPAKFIAELDRKDTISVNLPSQIIISHNGQNIVINNLTSHISYRQKGRKKEAHIYVVGILNLPSSNVPGNYEGVFDIDIDVND